MGDIISHLIFYLIIRAVQLFSRQLKVRVRSVEAEVGYHEESFAIHGMTRRHEIIE